MKKVLILITFIFILFLKSTDVVAGDLFVQKSHVSDNKLIKFYTATEVITDTREHRLKKFLESHRSPLAQHADKFVYYADKYEIDWRLVPAISGVESTFGKHIPKNSFNAYGWAGGRYKFQSWESSIEIVTKALKEKYINRGANTLSKINRIYCPPNPKWAGKVAFFIKKIDPNPIVFEL